MAVQGFGRKRRKACTTSVGPAMRAAVLALLTGAAPALALDQVTLTVPGASPHLMQTLQASSLLIAARDAGRTASIDLLAAARAEYGRLLSLLYEQGHYAPQIQVQIDGREAADIAPLSQPRTVSRIEVRIDLGPLFTFGRVDVGPLAPDTALPADLAPGQPARSTAIRSAVAAALDDWRARGHALADVASQEVTADHATQRLNLRLVLAPGPSLQVGQVTAQGNQITRDERVQAIAGLQPGERFDPAALDAAQARLRRTGAFTSVVLRPAEAANPDGTIDIEARVEEGLPRRLGFGVEIDSESGGRLSGFWLHRNLRGGAERLRLEAAVDGIGARVGGLGFALDARYTRPATLNRDTDLELGLNAVRLNEADFAADAFTADALLRWRRSPALTLSAGASLRWEAGRSGLAQDFGTLGLPLTLTYDTRDVPLDATRGRYLMAEAMPYLGFGAADNGVRLRLDARGYTDAGSDGRLVLAGRAQVGALVGSDLADTPRGFLFYSGGGGSVRGLPYQSLGVAGPPASGGLGFAAVSGEVRFRMTDAFSVVAFADAGAVSATASGSAADWHAGGGLGVRYVTPIGPLRLDLAAPLRRNAGVLQNRLQVYLGIGQAF